MGFFRSVFYFWLAAVWYGLPQIIQGELFKGFFLMALCAFARIGVFGSIIGNMLSFIPIIGGILNAILVGPLQALGSTPIGIAFFLVLNVVLFWYSYHSAAHGH